MSQSGAHSTCELIHSHRPHAWSQLKLSLKETRELKVSPIPRFIAERSYSLCRQRFEIGETKTTVMKKPSIGQTGDRTMTELLRLVRAARPWDSDRCVWVPRRGLRFPHVNINPATHHQILGSRCNTISRCCQRIRRNLVVRRWIDVDMWEP